jgi:hypothetical protein
LENVDKGEVKMKKKEKFKEISTLIKHVPFAFLKNIITKANK